MTKEALMDDPSLSYTKPHHKWKGYIRCDELVPPLCDKDMTVTEGYVKTIKGVKVAYWRYTPAKLDPSKHPIVVINGGPGLPHNYIKPARNLACDGREVVMYDQAGTGASWLDVGEDENTTEADFSFLYPELLTLHYYAHTELPALLDELGWRKYHVLAESWGTQVAFEFAVGGGDDKRPPKGLQSLLLNAPISDNRKFIEYQWDPVDGTIGTLPMYTQEKLQYFNSTRDFESEEFQAWEEVVMETFNARIGMVVDCWLDTEDAGIASINYNQMTGATDIFIPDNGVNMKGWTVLPQLHKLKDYNIPLQLNHGAFDMVRPKLIADTAEAVMKGRDNTDNDMVECHLLPRAAHSVMLDCPREVYGYIQDFLDRLESPDQDFQVKGTCPTRWDLMKDQDRLVPPSSWSVSGAPKSSSHDMVAVTVLMGLVAVAFSFFLGMRIGMRRNKKYVKGYEQVHTEVPAECELE